VSEYNGQRLRRVSPSGQVSTLAGTSAVNPPGGLANVPGVSGGAGLCGPSYMAFGAAPAGGGAPPLYVGSCHALLSVTPGGAVSTLAGSSTPGAADGLGTQAQFSSALGGAVSDGRGTLYLSDANRIRNSGVSMALRYLIPVFFLGDDASQPKLAWSIRTEGAKRMLVATNAGDRSSRVSNLRLDKPMLYGGLAGYVLGHSTRMWPLPAKVSGARVTADSNNGAIDAPLSR
jgi:hypothetical protein